ncbi:hypothetical protein IWW45_007242 [Coemansia sp. RSA 485]|nr:hypothetical protein IWW45_007242 [Coemansia sp. RSA 485]
MDQELAKRLFENGAFLVILDAPRGLDFGIDLDTWEIGPLFKGLKMIPPGIHYVHYSSVNSDKQVVVRQWCAETEQLYPSDHVPSEQVDRIRQGIRDLDKGLGAYPLDSPHSSYQRWQRLTSYITPQMIDRLLPPSGEFSSATGSVYEDQELQKAQKALHRNSDNQQTSPSTSLVDSSDRFNFVHSNIKHSFPRDAAPDVVMKYSKDKSWLLKSLLSTQWHENPALLLGEIQLSFVVIFVGQNFSGLEHWKFLLHLTLYCREALEDHHLAETLFAPLLDLLCVQLSECPSEFAASVLEQDNFIAAVLDALVLNVYECPDQQVKTRLEKQIGSLRNLLREKFSWSLPFGKQLQEIEDEEDGEYAPQVVYLD